MPSYILAWHPRYDTFAEFFAMPTVLEAIQNWDVFVLNAMRMVQHPLLAGFVWLFATVSWKGSFWWLLAAGMWLKKHRRFAAEMVIALLICVIEVALLKGVIDRPRPGMYAAAKHAQTELLATIPSFPSGHVALMMCGAVVVFARWKDWRGILALTITFCVSFARVYQGLHWPTDVIASLFLGIFAGIGSLYITNSPLLTNSKLGRFVNDPPKAPKLEPSAPEREKVAV
jgi:undecaprenyl-diphosphatase